MRFLLLLLGITGFAAVTVRVARTLLHLAHGGVHELLAGDLASTRAQRGDITGLQEAVQVRSVAVRQRRMTVGALVFWLGLLLLPPLTPWPALVYATYSLFWVIPQPRSART